MSKQKGRLIVISAPSGAGKGTVIGEMRKLNPDLAYSISATTRTPRPNEEHGREYYFFSPEEFENMAQRGKFLEHESYVGKRYGTLREPIDENIAYGVDTILEIEVKGARSVKQQIPEAVMIFIMPPDEDELRRRLTGRGTSSRQDLDERLAVARDEMAAASEYDHIIINDNAARAAREILAILGNG